MKRIALILSVISLIVFSSCSSDDETATNISLDVDITVKNSEGNDLLNPEDHTIIDNDSITAFYLVNGILKSPEETQDYTADSPKGFFIYKDQKTYVLRLFLNDNHLETDNNKEFSTTYIKWNNNDTDTLKAKIESSGNKTVCTKLWLNNQLVYKTTNGKARTLELVKP